MAHLQRTTLALNLPHSSTICLPCLRALQHRARAHPQLLRHSRAAQQSSRHLSFRSFVPTIAQPRFWRTLIPRRNEEAPPNNQTASHPTQPPEVETPFKSTGSQTRIDRSDSVFFLAMALLIGSQAIHLINLRASFTRFSRETESRLKLLREVVRRIQNGENVDVERELGVGVAEHEQEWENVMQELASEEAMLKERRKRLEKRKQRRKGGEGQQQQEDDEHGNTQQAQSQSVSVSWP